MKPFTVVVALFSVMALALWAFFETTAGSSARAQPQDTSVLGHGETGGISKAANSRNEVAVPVTGAGVRRVAPVYDTTGALVSDPTGTIWNASHASAIKISPVYDSTGALLSDPTGTIWSASHSVDMKIAPVFDSSGAVVSDPTGTLLNANPK